MPYLIRPATETDSAIVHRFICILEENNFDYTRFEQCYNENIRNKNYVYLLAESATGKVIGFISCHTQTLLHHCGSVAEIQELFVEETHRKLGVGGHLINHLQEILKNKECILLEVTAQNKRAATHQFYRRLGFAETHKKFTLPL